MAVLKKTIRDVDYESTSFPPFEWVGMASRLAVTLGPGVVSLLGSLTRADVETMLNQDAAGLVGAVNSTLASLKPKDLQALALDLLRNTFQGPTANRPTQLQIQSAKAFDLAFTDDLDAIFPVLWFALEANGFFGLGSIGKILKKKPTLPSPDTSSTTATAPS